VLRVVVEVSIMIMHTYEAQVLAERGSWSIWMRMYFPLALLAALQAKPARCWSLIRYTHCGALQ